MTMPLSPDNTVYASVTKTLRDTPANLLDRLREYTSTASDQPITTTDGGTLTPQPLPYVMLPIQPVPGPSQKPVQFDMLGTVISSNGDRDERVIIQFKLFWLIGSECELQANCLYEAVVPYMMEMLDQLGQGWHGQPVGDEHVGVAPKGELADSVPLTAPHAPQFIEEVNLTLFETRVFDLAYTKEMTTREVAEELTKHEGYISNTITKIREKYKKAGRPLPRRKSAFM